MEEKILQILLITQILLLINHLYLKYDNLN
jgi:hypothetical protein